jgi:hypothetical protein
LKLDGIAASGDGNADEPLGQIDISVVIDAYFRNNVARLAWAHKLVANLYSSHLRISLAAARGIAPNEVWSRTARALLFQNNGKPVHPLVEKITTVVRGHSRAQQNVARIRKSCRCPWFCIKALSQGFICLFRLVTLSRHLRE